MEALLNLFLALSATSQVEVKTHPCNLSMENLNPQARVEMGIGCSTKRGRTVYRRFVLEKIYEKGLIKE